MSKHTLDEKVRYHEQLMAREEAENPDKKYCTPVLRSDKYYFAQGYNIAVMLYNGYVKSNNETREAQKELTDTYRKAAKFGFPHAKGFMCGMRDAANERKAKKKR